MAEPISALAAAKLAKIGTAIANGLFGSENDKNRGVKILIFTLLCILFFLVYLIVSIPVLLFSVPFATYDELSGYYESVEEVNEKWEEEGITIPWLEVVALAGVLHEQDYSSVSNSDIRSVANDFVKKETEKVCGSVDGVKFCRTVVTYRLRSMASAAGELNLSSDELDTARNYLVALEEGGVRPPAGWAANPEPGWVWPVLGYDRASNISSAYGFRIHPITKKPNDHKGVDIVAPAGKNVVAAIDGTVSKVGEDEIYGKYIEINGERKWIKFTHLQSINVSKRQKVNAGDKIGTVGSTGLSTGSHLHYEVKEKGIFRSKHVNPLKYY